MTTSIGKRKIYVGSDQNPLKIEGIATEADILPGMLVAQNAALGFAKASDAATVFGQMPWFADKDSLRQKAVDALWTLDENMVALQARSGEFLNVQVAAAQNILAVGTPLSSNGDGTLKIAVTPATVGATSEEILAYADEIINTGGAVALVRVRIK